jgi:hypothetical protein
MVNPIKKIKEVKLKIKSSFEKFIKSIKEFIAMIEKFIASIREFKDEIFKKENSRYFAAFSYVPFAGWMVPLYMKREENTCQHHAKQGLILAVFFTGLVLFISIVDVFMPKEWREFRLILAILIYLLYLTYLTLCIYGARNSLNEKKISLPLFGSYIGRLKI